MTELLAAGTSKRGVEVDALKERVERDRDLRRRGEGALGALTSGAETTEGTRIRREVLLVLVIETLRDAVQETVVKVLTAEVSVSGGRFDLEDALFDREKRYIEGTSA